ncbi:hypothetical protein GMB86_11480 [Terrilactibacillus sp. BCM23-1]|uniref:Uncharacterized protein n=1 Tax=Terrilactibacillus tamarindi TaxID=2599694 RepID=A0A6N8CVZ8_9BACI|nr:hypothetical protein [Terrilactibacillus tamarindi]MTT32626.1 hypothetical protein [Terrilactibacillus tamarindi]
MKLFIEHILDHIEQIGKRNEFTVSLSSTKNEDNYLRGVLQFFDDMFNVHYVVFFSYPEEHPNLNYIFWILDKKGNEQTIEKDGSKEKMLEVVKELAIKEVHVNLAKGKDIRKLFKELENVMANEKKGS